MAHGYRRFKGTYCLHLWGHGNIVEDQKEYLWFSPIVGTGSLFFVA